MWDTKGNLRLGNKLGRCRKIPDARRRSSYVPTVGSRQPAGHFFPDPTAPPGVSTRPPVHWNHFPTRRRPHMPDAPNEPAAPSPTRARLVLVAWLCGLSGLLYLDRICMGQAVT